jgi:hypothetical protein
MATETPGYPSPGKKNTGKREKMSDLQEDIYLQQAGSRYEKTAIQSHMFKRSVDESSSDKMPCGRRSELT